MQIMVGPAIIRSPNLGDQFIMRNNSVQAVRQLNVSMENNKESLRSLAASCVNDHVVIKLTIDDVSSASNERQV